MDTIFRAATGPLDVVKVSKRVRQDALIRHNVADLEVADLKTEELDDIDLRTQTVG